MTMSEVNCTIEGISKTENPSISEIKQELNCLKNKRIEFVVLSKGNDFIQCIRDSKIRGYFRVSANINIDIQGDLFEHKGSL